MALHTGAESCNLKPLKPLYEHKKNEAKIDDTEDDKNAKYIIIIRFLLGSIPIGGARPKIHSMDFRFFLCATR